MVTKGVELVRAWNSIHNVVVADGLTIGLTSRAAWQNTQFQLLAAFLAAGWAMESSAGGNNGGGHTSGAGNFIVIPTDILGDSAGNNHSWARLSPPIGMFQGGTPEIVFDFVEPDAVTSALSQMWMSPTAFSGGTDTDRPTSALEALHGGFGATLFIASQVANLNAKAHYGWSDAGDVWVGITVDGSGSTFTAWRAVFTPDLTKLPVSGGPSSPNLAGVFISTQADNGQFDFFTQGQSPFDNSVTFSTSTRAWSPTIAMQTFVGGKSPSTGGVVPAPVDSWIEVGNKNRYLGKLADIRAVPNLTPANTVDQDDADPTRYMCLSSAPASGLFKAWIPITNAQGAIV